MWGWYRDMGNSGDHVFYGNLNGEYLDIVRGDGVYIYDENGKQYLDAASGVCVVSVGYGNQEIITAISNQYNLKIFLVCYFIDNNKKIKNVSFGINEDFNNYR